MRQLIFSLLVSLLATSPVFASFSSTGLETFGGTSLDASTWLTYNPQFISQNNGLIINAATPATISQYSTNFSPIYIGGSAQVEVTISSVSSATSVGKLVYLALSSAPVCIYGGGETYAVGTEIDATPPSAGFDDTYQHGNHGTGNGQVEGFTFNQPYTLGVKRISDTLTQFTISVYGSTIFNTTETWPAYEGPLYVALGGDSVNAEFNNLQLSGNVVIPEPSEMTWLLTTMSLLAFRNRNGMARCGSFLAG